MVIDEPERKALGENIVPMINVVFLLLIFFLMTATIAPPEPFEVAPPESRADRAAEVDPALLVGTGGRIAWGDFEGDAAISAVAAIWRERRSAAPLMIRADGQVEAAVIARLLHDLSAAGIDNVALIAVAPR